jgi:excisionase family DNA binding protein
MTRPTRRSQGAARSHFRFSPPIGDGSPAVTELIGSIASRLAAGRAVSVWVADESADVTPRAAAEMLGVSRQLVMRLIADGGLKSGRLPGSSHHRVPVEAVLVPMRRREDARARIVEASGALDAADVDYE